MLHEIAEMCVPFIVLGLSGVSWFLLGQVKKLELRVTELEGAVAEHYFFHDRSTP